MRLKTKDKREDHMKVVKEYGDHILSNKGIIGLVIGGGLGRGHSDDFSDVDFYVYLDSKTYKKWKKKPPIKLGSHKYKGQNVEIEIFDYEREVKKTWFIEDRWEREKHFTIFDTNKKVERLLKKKCVWEKDEREKLLKKLKMMTGWYLELAEDFISRGDLAQSHYVINVALPWILEIAFLKNKSFYPWPKWKIHYVMQLKKLPKNFERRIRDAMKVKAFDKKDVMRRVRILEKVLEELK